MSKLKIRAEFIRVAFSFTAVGSHVFGLDNLKFGDAMKSIYVEPHPSGKGVLVVSTDGGCLCVQWDRKGSVDRAYAITGLVRTDMAYMRGATINDIWLLDDDEGVFVRNNKKFPDTDTELPDVHLDDAHLKGEITPPGNRSLEYVDWRQVVPSDAEIATMQDGYPGMLNAAYLGAIAKLWLDNDPQSRRVRVRHKGSYLSPVLLTLPWRPDTFMVIKPMNECLSDPEWEHTMSEIMSTKSVGQAADPAEGL